ncbi:MAG: LytR C-terminal domain-containing protein [Patescibacteria group bacterium]
MEKIQEPKNAPKKSIGWLKIAIIAFIVGCILALSGMAFYFYRQYKKAITTQDIAPNKEEQIKKEVQSIKETISRFMELPGDEDPILATVTDIEKIKTQPFFAKAQNGDKVLIYTSAQKAILYRPSVNKIIEVVSLSSSSSDQSAGNIQPQDQTQTQNQSNSQDIVSQPEATVENIKIAVYNGSNIKGLAQRIGDKVALISRVTVSEKTNATGSYGKNLVIDLSGNRGELAQKIAEALGGEIGTLPESEKKPEADILVIAGKE